MAKSSNGTDLEPEEVEPPASPADGNLESAPLPISVEDGIDEVNSPVTTEDHVSSADAEPAQTENSDGTSAPTASGTQAPSTYLPFGTIPDAFAPSIRALESALGMPVWFLIQGNVSDVRSPFASMTYQVLQFLQQALNAAKVDQRVAFVIDSPGGDGYVAYRLARILARMTGGFDVVVPRYAKSAATLFALGAKNLYMDPDAELGPLDAQLYTRDKEEWGSALDEVQALDRLSAIALQQFDQAMLLLIGRTGMKQERLIPQALTYATEFTKPLLEKIDTVHFTQQSRILTVAEDYARRLLQPYYASDAIQMITERLVNGYNEHGFAIDQLEAREFLRVPEPSPEVAEAVKVLGLLLSANQVHAIGRLP